MSAPFPYEPVEMGDVPHWFGLPPDGCDVRHWLPFLEPTVIGIDRFQKLTVPYPNCGGEHGAPLG